MELQTGGVVQKSLVDFFEKSKSFQIGLLYIFFTLMIVFKEQIPVVFHQQADTFIGRLFIVASVYGITVNYSWIIGIIAAIAFALVLGLPRSIQEGFGSGGETSFKVIPTTKKWLVEKILKENPVVIEEEKVVTSAINS
jgi:hypothetical protein